MQNHKGLSSVAEVFSYLLGLVPNLGKWKISPSQREHRLERMKILLERFDNPHLAYQTFHVAGTKGKGSTAAFLASVLKSAGYRTGLYTSPHVSDPSERISVSVPPANNEILAGLAGQIRDMVESLPSSSLPGAFPLTAFELVTLFAFLYFRATDCQVAVIETGIGGRLDATNVIHPSACLLTPVELEHTDVLGDSIVSIAKEKSGIIKTGIPVFSAKQVSEVKNIFRKASGLQQSSIRFLDEEIERFLVDSHSEGTDFALKFKGVVERKFTLKLLGGFQAENAALVYLMLKHTLPQLDEALIEEGFKKAFLPGRMELIHTPPPIVLDGAHTPSAVGKLLASFRNIFSGQGILIFGCVSGKRIEEMANILAPDFKKIIISTPGYFKESHPEEVFTIFEKLNPNTFLEREPSEALQKALTASHESCPILVTGSFYMISEIRKHFL